MEEEYIDEIPEVAELVESTIDDEIVIEEEREVEQDG